MSLNLNYGYPYFRVTFIIILFLPTSWLVTLLRYILKRSMFLINIKNGVFIFIIWKSI